MMRRVQEKHTYTHIKYINKTEQGRRTFCVISFFIHLLNPLIKSRVRLCIVKKGNLQFVCIGWVQSG